MGYSGRVLLSSLSLSGLALLLVVFLLLTSQVTMALMPVVGIGGVYAEIDYFEGNDGTMYPNIDEWGSPATDTPECEAIPMLVIELQDGVVERFDIRKDIELPHLDDRWMSLRIEQPFGASIDLDEISFYTTQLAADSLLVRNIRAEESNFGGKWGSDSGEFVLEGGQDTASWEPGLEASNVEVWLHAVTGQGITFESTSSFNPAINVELEYPTTSELESYYDGRLGYNEPSFGMDREDYFGCTPTEQFN